MTLRPLKQPASPDTVNPITVCSVCRKCKLKTHINKSHAFTYKSVVLLFSPGLLDSSGK